MSYSGKRVDRGWHHIYTPQLTSYNNILCYTAVVLRPCIRIYWGAGGLKKSGCSVGIYVAAATNSSPRRLSSFGPIIIIFPGPRRCIIYTRAPSVIKVRCCAEIVNSYMYYSLITIIIITIIVIIIIIIDESGPGAL